MNSIIVSPSILTANFINLKDDIQRVIDSKTPWIHLDVMDGTFVPNISFGPKVISDIRKMTNLFFDAHLMVQEPDHLIDAFVKAGCDSITVHYEACSDIRKTLNLIKSYGIEAGISLKPSTAVSEIESLLDMVDQVLVMSVEPGFGGQSFMPDMLLKVRELKNLKGDRKYKINIDGGISLKNIEEVKEAGIDVCVAGSAFFNAEDAQIFVKEMSK